MPGSSTWRRYYEENAQCLLEIPWELGAELRPKEMDAVGRSVAEFQAGESSEGRHLLHAAQAYSLRTGDAEYVAAIRLFIAEEQRHARDLGRFLNLNGLPLVKTTFTDRVFRQLRHVFGGLEISIAVLLTAELIAKVYYAALGHATASRVLGQLCRQILRDEEQHVRFQAEQLALLRSTRGPAGRTATMALQRVLFAGTVVVVWILHRHVTRRAKVSFWNWWARCWGEFRHAFTRP